MSTGTTTCTNCRSELAATALFCPHCGRARVRDEGDALLGKVLGDRFLVVEKLGQGASGTIYRAEHVTLRRKVAIKVLHHELSKDDLALERFRREATTVADLDNEHIVEIHDFGRTPDGRLYLAMELLEGETLDAVLLREGRLPIDRAVDVMTQVGESLIEAHAVGYIHRDLRPRNLFLAARRGRPNFVKLLDFGLSKIVEKEGSAASTSLGMTFGDPRYMSPEQARGDAIDRRADLYQLGCVAYEMLTGAPPFTGGRVFDVLSRHVSEAPVPLSRVRPDVPGWLEAIVMQLLAKQPDDRFATMSRMVEALRLGASSGAVMPAARARAEETEPPPSVSRVMEKLGRTAMGRPSAEDDLARAKTEAAGPAQARPADPAATVAGRAAADHGAPRAVPEAVDEDAATKALPKLGPRGTPRVGVPVVTATEAPAGAQAAWARPKGEPAAETRADGIVGGYNPASPSSAVPSGVPGGNPGAASGVAGGPPAMPDRSGSAGAARRPSGDYGQTGGHSPDASRNSGSTGKLPTRTKRPSDSSSGISSVWYADGDKLDGGAELDDSQAARLERARGLIALGDSMSDGYAPARRPLGKLIAIGAGALGLVLVLVLVVSGGSSKETPKAAAKPALSTVAPDAAPEVATAVDAGVAAPTEVPGASADASVAAVTPTTTQPAAAAATKPVTTATKPETRTTKPDPKPRTSRTDPLDPVDDTPPPTTSSDEQKLQAEFYAKTGDGQLRNGDPQGAAASFKKALELDAKNVAAIVGLGEVAMQQGLYDAAIKHLKRAAKLAKGSAHVHTLLGECYLNNGNSKAAEAAFKRALQLDPDSERARNGYNEASSRIPPIADDPY